MPADDESGEPSAPSAVARARRVAGRGGAAGANPDPPRRGAAQRGVSFDDPTPPDEATPAPKPAPKSRAGRNLPAAIGVGVGLGAVIVGSLFLYRPSFAYIVAAAVLYGCYELTQALNSAGIKPSLTPLLVGSAALLLAAWERGPSGLVVGVLVTLAGVVVWRIADGALGYTRDVTASALILLYVPTLAGFAILLAHPDDGAARVIVFVATVVC